MNELSSKREPDSQRVVDWIVSLESGQTLRKSVSIFVKILGVLTLITAIVPDVIFIFLSINEITRRTPEGLVIILFFFSCLWIGISIFMGMIFVRLFWNRSNKIRDLGGESHFTLLPILALLIRLFGQGSFFLFIGTGIKSFTLSILLIIPQLMSRSPDYEAVVKVFITTGGLVWGSVVLLIVSYFVAELVNLFTSMGTNLKKIETQLSAKEDASGS